MNWPVRSWTSFSTVLNSIADAAKEVNVEKIDVVEGMFDRENMARTLEGEKLWLLCFRLLCVVA